MQTPPQIIDLIREDCPTTYDILLAEYHHPYAIPDGINTSPKPEPTPEQLLEILSNYDGDNYDTHYWAGRYFQLRESEKEIDSLTSSQLKYIMVSTASKGIRPTLQYAYYFPETKKLVSTDSFRLHELSIDLGEEAGIISADGVLKPIPKGHSFPSYTSFFYESPIVTTIIDREHLKTAMYYSKYSHYNTIVNFDTETIHSNRICAPHDMRTLEWSTTICTPPSKPNTIEAFSINAEHLHDSIRYCDAPGKKQDPTLSIRMKSPLSPLIIESTIDGAPCRSLLMPLKM